MTRVGTHVCAFAAMLVVAACAAEPGPPMRFGTDIWAGNEMLAVAEQAGHLPARLVRRVEFSSNQEVLRALRNGVIDGGALMLDETLVALHDGVDVVILAAVDSSIGADAILGPSSWTSATDLQGKRVGLQINSGALHILRRALSAAHLNPADITVVNVPPDRHVTAFITGTIDAVVTYDPMRTQLLSRGAADLYNSKAIAGDVINVLAVRRDYLAAHPDHGRALVDAWFAGEREFRDSQASRDWVAHRLDLSPEQLQRAMTDIALFDRAGSAKLLDGNPPPLRDMAHRFEGFMRENGRLTRPVPVDDLFRLPDGWRP